MQTQTQLAQRKAAGLKAPLRFCYVVPAARSRRVTLCRAFAENGNGEAKKEKVSQGRMQLASFAGIKSLRRCP